MKRGPQDWQEPTEEMPLLHTPAIYIGDVHGDAFALEKSFDGARWLDRRYTSILKIRRDKRNGTVILLGDLIDRWRQNIHVLESVFQLQDQMGERLVTLTGNHEPMMIQSLRNQRPSCIDHWLKNGGIEVLAELGMYRSLTENALHHADGISADGEEYFLSRSAPEEVNRHLITMFIAARQLFLRGRYASIFKDMKVTHAAGGILSVHAGINAHTGHLMEKQGMNVANRRYKETWDANRLDLWGFDEGLGGTLWRREGINNVTKALDPHTASVLKERGIRVLMHGHDHIEQGKQKWALSHGILEINNDTSMSRGYAGTENNSGSVEIGDDGTMTARNNVFGVKKIGRMEKDGVKLYVI